MYIIKKSEKTSKLGGSEVYKKEFHASKEPIALHLLDINQIITSDKRKGSNKGSKYFIGYEDSDIIRPLQVPIQRFWKEMALYVSHHGLQMKKTLGFIRSKKVKITLESISFWQNISIGIFKFSPFLYTMKACQ